MSAQDEPPECECYAGPIARVHHDRGPTGLCDTCVALRVLKITREEYATMRAAQEFTRVVCELLGNEGSGMDVSTDVLQDMLTAAGVTP